MHFTSLRCKIVFPLYVFLYFPQYFVLLNFTPDEL